MAPEFPANIPVQVSADLDEMLEDHQTGQVIAVQHEERWGFAIVRRANLAPEAAERFAAWARQRVAMLTEIGPEADGWFKCRSHDGWQITCANVVGPLDPFL